MIHNTGFLVARNVVFNVVSLVGFYSFLTLKIETHGII